MTVDPRVREEPLRDAWAVQKQAAEAGFDWPEISPVFDKIHEELEETREALRKGDVAHARREMGDLLFAVVNLSRFLDAHPWDELTGATRRFHRRFSRMRAELERDGRLLTEYTLAEMDAVWERIKASE